MEPDTAPAAVAPSAFHPARPSRLARVLHWLGLIEEMPIGGNDGLTAARWILTATAGTLIAAIGCFIWLTRPPFNADRLSGDCPTIAKPAAAIRLSPNPPDAREPDLNADWTFKRGVFKVLAPALARAAVCDYPALVMVKNPQTDRYVKLYWGDVPVGIDRPLDLQTRVEKAVDAAIVVIVARWHAATANLGTVV